MDASREMKIWGSAGQSEQRPGPPDPRPPAHDFIGRGIQPRRMMENDPRSRQALVAEGRAYGGSAPGRQAFVSIEPEHPIASGVGERGIASSRKVITPIKVV